ncbi:putative RNA recognition motif domain, nucleotide-binding alpha-beta plait domain superfamily [Helianthus debilis subsp. tardiflorus]
MLLYIIFEFVCIYNCELTTDYVNLITSKNTPHLKSKHGICNPNRRGAYQRPPVHLVRDTDDPASRTTFFVTNISDRVTGSLLKEAFKDFVKVTDAWVPRKRTVKGRVFGFVRCKKIKDPYEVLQGLNEIVIMDMRISVALALFDRAHKKISYDVEGPAKKVWLPRDKNVVTEDFPTMTSVYGGSSGLKKTVQVQDGGAVYPIHCMGRAVIGVSDSIAKFHIVKRMLVEAGYPDAAVSYIGGLSALITFRDNVEMNDFMVGKENVWKGSLVTVSPWTGQDTMFERMVLLKVVGVPILIRDNTLFDRIGGLFGNVVGPSDFSWLATNNSAGFTHVLTKNASRIDEEVNVFWKGKNYSVWVAEECSSWVPDFEPIGNVPNDDEMEKGEIRDKMAEHDDGGVAGVIPTLNEAENEPGVTGNQEDVMYGNYDLPKVVDPVTPVQNSNNLGQGANVGLDTGVVGQVAGPYLNTNGPTSGNHLDSVVGSMVNKNRKRTRIFFIIPQRIMNTLSGAKIYFFRRRDVRI